MLFDIIFVYISIRLEGLGAAEDMVLPIDAKRLALLALANTALWGLLVAANMILDPLILDRSDWEVFRGGVAIAITAGGLLAIVAGVLSSDDPTAPMGRAARGFHAYNVLVSGLVLATMTGILIWGMLELVSQEHLKYEYFEEPAKVYFTALLTVAGFFAYNLSRLRNAII